MIQSILAALFYVLQNLSNKLFSGRFKSGPYSLSALTGLALALGTVLLAALFRPQPICIPALLFALAFGVVFVITISMIAVTMSRGPLGLSALIVNMNVVISVLFGALAWHEPITAAQCVGLALLLGVIVALSLPERRDTAPVKLNWLLTALLTMLLNGALSVIQTSAFRIWPELSASDFTFWSLAAGAVVCGMVVACMKLRRGAKFMPGEPVRLLPIIAAGLGVGTAVAYYFHNEALRLLPSVVVFPVIVGLNCALLMLASVLFFGERISWRKGVAFAVGILGILMMNP